jgi:glycosyltransferase involved in cell wall biosynthesis
VGGSETMLIDILNEQSKENSVALIIVNNSFSHQLITQINKNVRIVYLGRERLSRSISPIIKLNYWIWKLKPSVIHLHQKSLAKMIFAKGRSKFLTIHDLHITLEHVGKVNLIAISDAVKNDILNRYPKVYSIQTIYNGINTSAIRKRQIKVFNNVLKIVQVARLEHGKKGQDILIRSIAELKKRGIDNVHVDFIGMGSSLNFLTELCKSLNIEEQIHFLGLKDREYIYEHLKEYDLMCHPARYEGFGLVVAEGMAAMLPVLVSNSGGPYEIIGHDQFGFAFEMEEIMDCTNKIEYIYRHYDDALNYVHPAYQHVCNYYSVKRMVSEYCVAYKNRNCSKPYKCK